MKVSSEIHALSQEILEMFDAHRIKQRTINKVNEEQKTPANANKWDKLNKEMVKDEKIDSIN